MFGKYLFLRLLLIGAVLQHLHIFERNQAVEHHYVQMRQQAIEFLFGIDDFDDHRQVHRKPQNFRCVQVTVGAETHWTTQDRGASQPKFARLQHNRFVKRLVMPAVAFADEDAEQFSTFRNFHVTD